MQTIIRLIKGTAFLTDREYKNSLQAIQCGGITANGKK